MRVLVLSWDARADDGGLAPQAAGLAEALAAHGHVVRVVTRLGSDQVPPELDRVEVHAVADAPPIAPTELDEPVLAALAFAARATSVAVRRIEEAPVDVVHAEGWQTGPVVAALREVGAGPVVAVPGPPEDGDGPRADIAAQLARDADRVVARSATGRDRLAAAGVPTVLLPPGVWPPARTPGPPPGRGGVVLVAPPGRSHRAFAGAVRDRLATPRRLGRSWRRRPFAVVVLDDHDLDSAVRGLAAGVPVLAADGPVADLVRSTGAGIVVAPDPAAVAGGLDRLARDSARAEALGRAATAAAQVRAWPAVASAWIDLAGALPGPGGPRHLRAAD